MCNHSTPQVSIPKRYESKIVRTKSKKGTVLELAERHFGSRGTGRWSVCHATGTISFADANDRGKWEFLTSFR